MTSKPYWRAIYWLAIEHMDKVNHLVTYLKDLNAGQGPGYCAGVVASLAVSLVVET
eukprot:SAG31_NODE_2544_length_5534_cov_3.478197_2_plen_56_part_00